MARAFGCARVVFNDCLRLRDACHEAGEKIADTAVQRQVVTLAKQTPERAWLGEVSSVVLVQACQDARRAYRNWFDSLSGKRKGRRVGHPGFGVSGAAIDPAHPQRILLARGAALCGEGGRDPGALVPSLPSEPSSVTVISEPDGRYYASFVAGRQAAPLPASAREVGIDVGLDRLAVTSDGEIIASPRFLRAKERHLARAQRALSRKAKGSANRAKARRRVAVLHRKVRETRLDHAHKTALRLVRENQAVYAEDLAMSGLARTRLAKSVHDAGWAQLAAAGGGEGSTLRAHVPRIGRFEPTSQVCSACGIKDGPKPLSVRSGHARQCGAVHDRDVNAARNILAAGRADRLNACGGR